ncbi:MAG: hypothetical protein ACTSYB_06345 [Candidatus Helarchaeota archaeon]
MSQLTNYKDIIASLRTYMQFNAMSPIMEEGLLIGIAIVAILIILGIIFGVFDWIAESFSSLFNHF